jgi:branched-chain amino acid transport system permease protein
MMGVRLSSPASAVLLLVLALAFAVPFVLPSYYVSVATQILIFALLAMSVDILAGFVGRTPLCHGAIFGTSTYVVLYCTTAQMPLLAAILLGVAAATALATVFGMLAVRTSGVYFLLLTLALGLIVWGVCLRWTQVTGGENGLRGQLHAAIGLSTRQLYALVLGVVAAVTFTMWRFVHSPFGLTLRGVKEGESRMASLGYNVPLHLLIAFAASGFFAGIAGVLYALFNDFVSPSTVQLSQSVSSLLMVIVGGVGTLFGGFVGAFLVISLEQAVSLFTERWSMVLGLTFIGIMIFIPEGIIGRAQLALAARSLPKKTKH